MTRQEANVIIAKEILKACEDPKGKFLRFWQLLAAMHIVEYDRTITEKPVVIDKFNEESVQTLIKMLKESNI